MNLFFKYPHFVVLLCAYVIADISVAVLTRLASRMGATDRPGVEAYKIQVKPVPFVGGIAIFIGFIAALMLTLDWNTAGDRDFANFFAKRETRIVLATLIGGASMALLGLLDDFKPINALIKLGVLVAVVGLLGQLGLVAGTTPWYAANLVITALWVVGVISAFNAIDNTDGVAGITGASVALITFFVAWGTSASNAQETQSFVAIALFGATVGFLRHNRPKARVYLGNSGSFAMGFVVAVMALSGGWTSDPVKSALAPILLLSYPLFDLGYSTLMRWKAGVVRNPIEAVVVSGRDHTAHRLSAMGVGPWGVMAVVGAVNMLAGGAAFAIVRYKLDWPMTLALTSGVGIMYLAFGWSIRNAVDLRSPEARITLRRPAAQAVNDQPQPPRQQPPQPAPRPAATTATSASGAAAQ